MSAVGQGEPKAIGDKNLYRFEQKVPIQVSKKSIICQELIILYFHIYQKSVNIEIHLCDVWP